MSRRLALLVCFAASTAAHAGFYTVTNTSDSGSGSLRQAITSANNDPATPASPHTISIVTPGGSGSTATITLASVLPVLNKPTLMLGPANRTVILQPAAGQRGNFSGLSFAADAAGSSLYFLSLQGFSNGVDVRAANFTLVGSTLRDNRFAGLAATDATGLTVGGDSASERNVFVENGWEPGNSAARAGALIRCTQLDGAGECNLNLATTITGNYFGMERDGVTAAGNDHYGLLLESARGVTVGGGNSIGGPEANGFVFNGNSGLLARQQSRNVTVNSNVFAYNGALGASSPGQCAENFWANYCDGATLLDSSEFLFRESYSGLNHRNGIAVHGGLGLHRFEKCVIGVSYDEDNAPIDVHNGQDGIHLNGGNDSSVGTEGSAANANVIGYNGRFGIKIAAGQRNAVHPNSIFTNFSAGIDVSPGINGGQQPPTVNSLSPVSGTVGGSGAGLVYLFADGDSEGEFYLGQASISGSTFSTAIDLSAYAGLKLTAVATRGGNSSRFSSPVPIMGTPTYTLSVNVTGSGSVSSSPTGIACPGTCSASFNQGTTVTLAPTPASGWTFQGWSGACSGVGACIVTMNQARSVTATFTVSDEHIFGDGFED